VGAGPLRRVELVERGCELGEDDGFGLGFGELDCDGEGDGVGELVLHSSCPITHSSAFACGMASRKAAPSAPTATVIRPRISEPSLASWSEDWRLRREVEALLP
jgi:hypothetical protein